MKAGNAIEKRGFVVAIDGPAASGKGTLGRKLAAHFGLRHLDTGLTYRAVAQALLAAGKPVEDEALAVRTAAGLDLDMLDRQELSRHEIGEAASRVAVMPAVRRVLVAAQREFASRPPGAVVDGRDIGTVVFPDADIKFFVTASPETRARRRFQETMPKDRGAQYDRILADIRQRDARDRMRADSPLKPAADAHLIDTTTMDIETAFATVLSVISKVLPSERK